jgi:hypothetical protein
MLWSFLADLLVVVHFAFTAFVVLGGFLSWRWPRIAFLHLPALAWGAWIELSHAICPLTPLENRWRQLGGEAGYTGSFLAHYLGGILYPAHLSAGLQYALAAALLALNAVAYLLRRKLGSNT